MCSKPRNGQRPPHCYAPQALDALTLTFRFVLIVLDLLAECYLDMAKTGRSPSSNDEEAFVGSGSTYDPRLSSSTLNENVRQEQEQGRGQDIVDFEKNGLDNPLQWPYWRKLSIQLLVACMYMLGYVSEESKTA